jgi:hypothetical protein
MRGTVLIRLCFLLLLTFAAAPFALGADAKQSTYYVQLIRGNNDDHPPASGARQIGPRLTKRFRPVFKWENYWEMSRQEVVLTQGQKTRLKLSKEREVEIDLTNPAKRKVIAYSAGKPVCSATRPVGEAKTIIGADRDANSVWFIVVRRDKPVSE